VQGGKLLRSSVSGNLTYNDPAFPGVTVVNLFSDTSRQIDLSKSALAGVQFGWNWQLGDGSDTTTRTRARAPGGGLPTLHGGALPSSQVRLRAGCRWSSTPISSRAAASTLVFAEI
jgi:hypothetical protein